MLRELCSGRRTRTSGLRVMSPTSYQLLYPAILDCKYTDYFWNSKFLLQKFRFLDSLRSLEMTVEGLRSLVIGLPLERQRKK